MLKHFVSLFMLVAFLAGSSIGQLITPPLLPSLDPFYQPPAGFESQEPGAILRTRKVATAYFGLIPNPVQAWQLLYRTNAVDGSAIASVTTVFKPLVAKNDRFVSFQTAYDGAARSGVCDPSYNYRLFAPQIDLISSVEFLLLQAFILDGNIVSASDYEGPDAAFGAGRLAGTGVLDSMRAVKNFKSTLGFSTDNPKVVGYGYSGGAIATGWAAGLQPSYAPELDIKGWAHGGTPANLTGTALLVDGTLFSGFLPQALAGLSAPTAYGAELLPVYDQIITPYGQTVLDLAEQICSVQNIFTFAFQEVQSTKVQTLGDQIFYEPTISSVLTRNNMGLNSGETPTAPVYMFHAPDDEIIPYANATTLRDDWCGFGASVEFVTIAAGGHATTEVIGFPGAFKFVKDAFDGNVGGACSSETVLDETLNPLALGLSLEPILVQLLNALAIAGRKDANIISDVGNLNKTAT
ncbi:hypothetical protein WHR41_02697 [Cladosporium halotolerans]|uniref:LIP-domain-containing protein n=1 Tax=Cladosporium halotolerans TaxID=1052096 RepID=A0AB34KYK1_9PEZI